MQHRKKENQEYVAECRDSSWCKLGNQCWYKHTNKEIDNENDEHDKSMVIRVFYIMEKYGHRIEHIENS